MTLIPSQIREAVLKSQGNRCQRCGSRSDLTMDHVKPLSKGGRSKPGNLQVLCQRCNQLKGSASVDYRGKGRRPARRAGKKALERLAPKPPIKPVVKLVYVSESDTEMNA